MAINPIVSGGSRSVLPPPPPVVDAVSIRRWMMDASSMLARLGVGGGADDEDVAALETAATQLVLVATAQQEFIDALVEATDVVLTPAMETARAAWEAARDQARDAITALSTQVFDTGAGRTALVNEGLIRIEQDQNIAAQITATNARLATSEANVTALQQTVATGDTALAQQIGQLTTTVGSNTSSIQTMQTSINGISASWAIQVNSQNQVQGVVRLDGSASGSTFTVIASQFQIALPGMNGGTPQQVFVAGTVNGAASIGIRADVMLDGSIVARHLSVSSLSAITANMGTITAGLLQSPSGKTLFDLNNDRLRIMS